MKTAKYHNYRKKNNEEKNEEKLHKLTVEKDGEKLSKVGEKEYEISENI